MNPDHKFLEPGSDGEPAPESLWRKGLVYTLRTRKTHRDDYRISVGFKKGVAAVNATTGFQEVYHRVTAVGRHRISQLTCPDTGDAPRSIILGQTWRPLGDNIITSLITLSLRCPGQSATNGELPPDDEALRSPGGSTLEELERLAPQHADEIYNEFDFTDPSSPNPASITLSYGESVAGSGTVFDFEPFVKRAGQAAHSYYQLLRKLGDASAAALRIRHREWFLASPSFVTIHVCFDP